MFKVKKTLEVAVSHKLSLSYDSKCVNNHGHNLKIVVWCASEELNDSGMVIDFTEIKRVVDGQLDHKYLNDIKGIGWEENPINNGGGIIKLNPTAERIAEWICMQIRSCYRVDVQESTGNVATYEGD